MKTRIALALRHKITIAFSLLLVGGLVITVMTYRRHTLIQEKMTFIEVADDLVNNALEVRRYEKNFFLYGEMENFDLMMEFLSKTEQKLQRLSENEHRSISNAKLKSNHNMLVNYKKAVTLFSEKLRSASPVDSGEAELFLTTRIRDLGRSFTESMLEMVITERRRVDQLVEDQKRSIFYPLAAFILLALGVGYYLFFLIIAPLSRIEKAAKEVIEGQQREIPITSAKTSEIQSLTTVLNMMIKELDKKSEQLLQREKMAALGTLTSGVAHELNNPLSNISSSTQILLEEINEGDLEFKKMLLAGIEEQVEKARDIVKSLLEFAREREFEPVLTDMETLVEKTVKLVHSEIPPDVEIEIDIPYTLELEVDQRRLSQALINLILNGVQAMEDAGGKLTISAYYSPRNDNAIMEIKDTGVGIPSEKLAKIFDPFFSTKEEKGGSGLGLYVTYGIIQKHNGEVSVYSEIDGGTKFIITLPLKQTKNNHDF